MVIFGNHRPLGMSLWVAALAIGGIMLGTAPAEAQLKTIRNNNQVWIGYITSTRINDHYSWWNDFHLVPGGFFIARTGLTRQLGPVGLTMGYAWVLSPVNSTHTQLERKEHRPWAQLYYVAPVGRNFQFIHRIRYEARFRQNVVNSQITDGYVFTNRFRYMIGIKKIFERSPDQKFKPFVMLADEMLLNFGKNAPYTFDQNRVMASVGIQSKHIQVQVGWMNRFVQTGATAYTLNHTVYLWVTHNLSFRKKSN